MKKIKQLAIYNLSNLVSCYIVYDIFMRLLKPFCISFFFFNLTETFSHESMVFHTNFIVTLKLEKLKNDERAAVRIKYDYVCKVLDSGHSTEK